MGNGQRHVRCGLHRDVVDEVAAIPTDHLGRPSQFEQFGDPFRRDDFVHLKLVNAGSAERFGLRQVGEPAGPSTP